MRTWCDMETHCQTGVKHGQLQVALQRIAGAWLPFPGFFQTRSSGIACKDVLFRNAATTHQPTPQCAELKAGKQPCNAKYVPSPTRNTRDERYEASKCQLDFGNQQCDA